MIDILFKNDNHEHYDNAAVGDHNHESHCYCHYDYCGHYDNHNYHQQYSVNQNNH